MPEADAGKKEKQFYEDAPMNADCGAGSFATAF